MKKEKSEKLLSLYYKEQFNNLQSQNHKNKLETVLKVAMILNFSLLIFVPLRCTSKLDLTGIDRMYNKEIMNISENINKAFKG